MSGREREEEEGWKEKGPEKEEWREAGNERTDLSLKV